ncbi:hypothetical protein [Microterricola pindariensis]|uniref:hypothetical protein n=1 Tax=Microterricola pindariensis TaxID=478010 RepID=UPI001374DC08|nr:hypothetical protein [Microterricola pindariensis]
MGAEAQPVGDDHVPRLLLEGGTEVDALPGRRVDEHLPHIGEHLGGPLPAPEGRKRGGQILLVEVGGDVPRHDVGAERGERRNVGRARVHAHPVPGGDERLGHGAHRRDMPGEGHDGDHDGGHAAMLHPAGAPGNGAGTEAGRTGGPARAASVDTAL